MMGQVAKRPQFLAPDGEEHAFWAGAERQHCVLHGGDNGPAVAGLRRPWRAAQGDEGDGGCGCGCGGVGADAGGERMCGIDQAIGVGFLQVTHQTRGAAETADAVGNWGQARRAGATGQRQGWTQILEGC